jgi:hypothetical protein
MRKPALLPTLLACVATVAYPCGGSQVDFVDGPLASPYGFVERALFSGPFLDYGPRDEVRFLPGLVRADSTRFAALLQRMPLGGPWPNNTWKPVVAEPDGAKLDSAWAQGDLAAATRIASDIVARVMALPAANDSLRNAALRLAVETIELAPLVADRGPTARRAAFDSLAQPYRDTTSGMHPPHTARAGSMAYADILNAMQSRIPDGSREEIARSMSAAGWDSLLTMQREFLREHDGHPYTGLVRFLRLRTFFLASQSDSAWRTALSLYREYPARAAVEMRYLLLTGVVAPAGILTDNSVPIDIRVSLVGNLRPNAMEWDALMRHAIREPRAPWSENLQERLFASAATDTALSAIPPLRFPTYRPSASLLWRYLYAANMMRAGELDRALPFATSFTSAPTDSVLSADAAALASRIHLQRGDWRSALAVRELDPWTRRYLLRVLAPDSVIATLPQHPDRWLAAEARLVLANRAALGGRWRDAATLVQPVDAARAARYTRLGILAADSGSVAGLLRFARALEASHGKLFFEARRYFHRGIVSRDWALSPPTATGESPAPTDMWDLPWSRADERRRMYAYFRNSAERYLALQTCARALQRTELSAADRRAAVRDANVSYRGLLATDPSRQGDGYWGDSLAVLPASAVIRRAGRGP